MANLNGKQVLLTTAPANAGQQQTDKDGEDPDKESSGEPENAENFDMTTFTTKLDKHWQEGQEKSDINLKSLSNEESEKANQAEEVVSDIVR